MKFQKVDIRFLKKPKRKVSKFFIHCSASDNPKHDAREIEKWHLARGFSEIGYHFFIPKDGKIIEGRSLENVPAAQEGHNTGSIAVCVHGLEKEKFTKEQRISLYALCRHIKQIYNNKITFHGHCEVSNKSCPVFDYREWLSLDNKGYME